MSDFNDARQFSAAAERNRQPILEVLKQVLPPQGTVLEIASGSGQHAAFWAPQLAPRFWLPSEFQADSLASIRAWSAASEVANLLPPLVIDVCQVPWPVETGDLTSMLGTEVPAITAIVNLNMIHISPWQTCLGLLAGANRILPPAGVLYLYGPFKRQGKHTAPSNQAFDDWLQTQNRAWGVRNLEDVMAAASDAGLTFKTVIDMPANNLSVIFQQRR